jgi:enterochelin esterase family protein
VTPEHEEVDPTMPLGTRATAPAPPVARSTHLQKLLGERSEGIGGWSSFWADVARRGTPLLEPGRPGFVVATFLARADPATTRAVYLELEGVTDRTQLASSTLRHYDGSDIWSLSLELPEDWRGSYRFVPSPVPLTPPSAPVGSRQELAWWSSVLRTAHPDPYQLGPVRTVAGRQVSVLSGPAAPDQRPWSAPAPGGGAGGTTNLRWSSELLGNDRTVWVHRTPGAGPDGHLLVLVDARTWISDLDLDQALDRLVTAGILPPLTAVMIDSVEATRHADLCANPRFVWAVSNELLPSIKDLPTDPSRTIVSGQGYGGVFALFAAIVAPERFGSALVQSASFWWPGNANGDVDLTRQPEAEHMAWLVRHAAPKDLRIHLRVGAGEWGLTGPTRRVGQALEARLGQRPLVAEYSGGHDWVCWQDGLVAGLTELTAAPVGALD